MPAANPRLVSLIPNAYLGSTVATPPAAGRIRLNAASARAHSANALTRLFGRIRGLLFADTSDRKALGARGERMAVRRLRRARYRIVARNYQAAGAEIDAIALDGDTLVFVEVKTRLSMAAGAPQESVNRSKRSHLRRAAAIYARTHRMENRPLRFDVVAVTRRQGRWQLEIVKDAF